MLYVLATPIGNLGDISDRAKEILAKVEVIIAENPSYSKRLTDHLGLSGKKFIQFAEHNEEASLPKVMAALSEGDAVLISDAGTPGISDPGFRIVRAAVQAGIEISPIPGPSAAITALCASGLPTDRFIFLGFVPKSEVKLVNELEGLREIEATVVFYESPYRINKTIGTIANTWGDARVVIARELTKMHEEFIRGTAQEVSEKINARGNLKGEMVVLISWK